MAPSVSPTIPTYEPTTPTKEFVYGTWNDDFEYVNKDVVSSSISSDIYDNGWYVMYTQNECKHVHQLIIHLIMHCLRIVWNGNDYWDDTPDYDAVTLNSDWMVINNSAMVNQYSSDSSGNLYWWRTILDRIGYATTPTSGYTETEIDGSGLVQFHGPFQRRMLLGTPAQGSDAIGTGKYVHLMRY